MKRINVLAKVSTALQKIKGTRLGVIGAPSDWLISSHADRARIASKLGITLVDIPISDVTAEYNKAYDNNLGEEAEKAKQTFAQNAPEKLAQYADGAFRIYKALKSIIHRHNLSGITLRCFDLLDTLGNTGCVALAILNAEGIPAGCEGDVPTLISMTVGNALTGVSGFQANPSRINPDKGELLFAHCTVPLNMVQKYGFDTHFESGIGVAICGHMPSGDATIFKVSGDLSRTCCFEGELTGGLSGKDLCRTQILFKLDGNEAERKSICTEYFLKNPIGNHHVIFPGKCKELFEALAAALNQN